MDPNTSQMKRKFFRKKGSSKPQSSLETPAGSWGSSSSSPSSSIEHPIPENNGSGSLDLDDFKMNGHRRYIPAPRRARSAERFDGMRIYNGGGGSPAGDFSYMTPGRSAEFHGGGGRSQQAAAAAAAFASLPPHQQQQIRQSIQLQQERAALQSQQLPPCQVQGKCPLPGSMSMTPSPPPPYTMAVNGGNDKSGYYTTKQMQYSSYPTQVQGGPPSYKQALAMNGKKMSNSSISTIGSGGKGSSGSPVPPSQQQQQGQRNTTIPRYAMANRGMAQSFDTGMVNSGRGGGGGGGGGYGKGFGTMSGNKLLSSSVPAFNEEFCNCSKCVKNSQKDKQENSFNDDAVYMESQAFLMHEIMTDGMAFCSIV